MSKKENKTEKISNGGLSKYEKKYTVTSKRKIIIGIASAVALIGAAGTGGYFISKAVGQKETQVIYVDPSKQKDADVTYETNSSGDKIANVSSQKSGKIISSVEVTIGGVQLVEGTEYKIDKISSNGSGNQCQVTIFKAALDAHKGTIYVAPIFEDEVGVVVFNSNGGSAVNVQQVKLGSKAKKPEDPTKENYEFDGWYSDEAFTTPFNFDDPITKTVTLYAKWNIPVPQEGILSFKYNASTDSYYACVSKKNKDNLPARLRIPAYYDGKKVTAISRGYGLEEEKISFSAGGVGNGAFSECNNLEEVVIPETIEWIDDYAFMDCKCLRKVSFEGNKCTSIGYAAFKRCRSLMDIELKEGLLQLDNDTFNSCTSLQSIKLPDSLYVIPDGCFAGCSALKKVTLGENVTKIGDGSDVLKANTMSNIGSHYVLVREALEVEGERYKHALMDDTSDEGAFEECTSLKEINIPESVTSIAPYAFDGCKSLTTKYFNVCDTFSNWYYLESTDDETKEVIVHGRKEMLLALNNDYALFKKPIVSEEYDYLNFQYSGKAVINGETHYYCTVGLERFLTEEDFKEKLEIGKPICIDIPDTIEFEDYGITLEVYKIADDGFNLFKSAQSREVIESAARALKMFERYRVNGYTIKLPSTLEYIGDRAFLYNGFFKSGMYSDIEFNKGISSLISIGDYAFMNTQIARFNSDDDGVVNIPDTTKKIGKNAFSNCIELYKANLPASLEEIPTELAGSSYLSYDKSQFVSAKPVSFIFSYPFFGSNVSYIDVDGDNKYYMSDDGNLYSKINNMPSELISCTNFNDGETYTLAKGTTSINNVAFLNSNCYSNSRQQGLKGINFSDELKYVNDAFYYYKKYLTYSTLGEDFDYSIEDIDVGNNNNFEFKTTDRVLISKDEKTLYTSLMYVNEETPKYTIPDTVTKICNGAFLNNGYDNTTLSINTTSKLEEVGTYAFAYNGEFDGFYIPNTIESIGSCVFYNTKVNNIYIHTSWLANVSTAIYKAYFGYDVSTYPTVHLQKDIKLEDDSFLKDLYGEPTTEGDYKIYIPLGGK